MYVGLHAASSANSYTKTLGGIDVAGRRLADEVRFGIILLLIQHFSFKFSS